MKDKYRRASLAKALNESSHHVINRETLKRTRDTAVLINTGRGKLIDEKAPADQLVPRLVIVSLFDLLPHFRADHGGPIRFDPEKGCAF